MCGASSPCQQDEKLGDRSWGISLFGAGSGISCRVQSRKIQYHINRFSALKILIWLQRGGLQGGGGQMRFALKFLSTVCVFFHPCGSLPHLSIIVFFFYLPLGNNSINKAS